MKADYNDAVGFNIFDLCLALGPPLVLDTNLQIPNGGDGIISMAAANAVSYGGVQTLIIVLIAISIETLEVFLSASKEDDN